jgi:hypothetical protein
MKAKRAAILALFACLAFAGANTVALAEPLVDFDGGSSFPNSGGTFGYSFTVSDSGISVGGLGVFSTFYQPLQTSKDVGLWNANGDEIATATVTPGDPTVASFDTNGQWLEATITPLFLTAGKYYVGAYYPTPNDEFMLGEVAIDSIAGVTYVDSQLAGGSALSFPDIAESARGELAGPTVFTAAVTPVPEPLTLSLFGAGVVGAAAMRRRKKAQKA